jgi:hypothetical protein
MGGENGTPLRGATLVAQAVEAGKRRGLFAACKPMPASLIHSLKFEDGRPLSPAMRALLEVDAMWLGIEYDESDFVVDGVPLEDFVAEELDEEFVNTFFSAYAELAADCVPFNAETSRPACLYLGQTDTEGEFPVIMLESWEQGEMRLGGFVPFDVWLAQELGALEGGRALEDVPPEYAGLPKQLANENAGGCLAFVANWSEPPDDEDDEDDEDDGMR